MLKSMVASCLMMLCNQIKGMPSLPSAKKASPAQNGKRSASWPAGRSGPTKLKRRSQFLHNQHPLVALFHNDMIVMKTSKSSKKETNSPFLAYFLMPLPLLPQDRFFSVLTSFSAFSLSHPPFLLLHFTVNRHHHLGNEKASRDWPLTMTMLAFGSAHIG